ncbi:hypothetical protein [Streptomyces sp. NPDC002640]
MPVDMSRFATNRWIKTHPNNVYTHGSTEPILSVLDVRGFELHDFFLVGLNDSCGAIYFPTEDRARAAAQALEPAYATEVAFEAHPRGEGMWATRYNRRALDGTELSNFITSLTLEGGRQVIENGRWVS